MFLLFPLRVKEFGGRDTIPTANALLIVINILVFFLQHTLSWADPLRWAVGPGSGFLTILTYGFTHASVAHLLGNMWVLWLVGNPVNRRLGDGYYLTSYLGTLLALGLFAKLFLSGYLLGSSGAIFAVILLFLMLMPRAVVTFGYLALFPFTILTGLVWKPSHWVYWFLRWDSFTLRAWVGLILVPLLEVWGLVSIRWWEGYWNWTNLGHLFGLMCGVAIVLLLPTQITMRGRVAAGSL